MLLFKDTSIAKSNRCVVKFQLLKYLDQIMRAWARGENKYPV